MFTAEKGIMQGYGYEIVTLAGSGHEVRILPENGFNLYYWTYEGKEIFMEPADITVFGTKYGNPILFPTPNRVKNATYTWRGETRVMKKRGAHSWPGEGRALYCDRHSGGRMQRALLGKD